MTQNELHFTAINSKLSTNRFHPSHLNRNIIKMTPREEAREVQEDLFSSTINPSYSFHHLHIGEFNSIIYRALWELLKNPIPLYNPLFITSELNGIGKTHFAKALTLELQEKYPDKKQCYISSEAFSQEFVTALRTDKIEGFKYKYRQQIDTLILEDIHLLSGKRKTQNELLFAFEQLIHSRKKIIFTSAKPPKQLKNFDPRLLSRFSSGLILNIAKPKLSDLKIIAKKKSSSLGLFLTDEMINAIALNSPPNFHELEGILIRLLAKMSLEHEPLSLETLEKVLLNTLPKKNDTNINLETIENLICKNYGISSSQLKTRSRKQHIAEIRMLSMAMIRKYTNLPHATIGTYYNKNHNTVIHACDAIEAKKHKSPIFKLQLEHIEKQIQDLTKRPKSESNLS